MNTIIDIIERSQMRHALQKEHELPNLEALSHSPVAVVKSEGIRNGRSADIDSRASRKDEMVTAARWPRSTGRDVRPDSQLLERDCDMAVPARWAWVPLNSNCKLANTGEQTRNLMIIEFNDLNAGRKQNE